MGIVRRIKHLAAAAWRALRRVPQSRLLRSTYVPLKKRFLRLSKSQRYVALGIVVVVAVLAVRSVMISQPATPPTVAGVATPSDSGYTGSHLKGPDYRTMLPDGKTIEQLGGWTRVSPSNRNPVFAYHDYIGKIPINVSQQPLPDEFKEDVESSIAELAHGYHADTSIEAGDTTAYIGTSAKGPQSVILAKNDLLILIKSSVAINDKLWVRYIDSLK